MYAINIFLRKNLNLYFLYSGILRYSFLHLGFFPVLFFSLFTNRACKKIFLIVNLLLWGDNCFEGGDLCIQRCPQLKKALIEDFVKELKTAKLKELHFILLSSYLPHGAFAEESVLFALTLPLQKPVKKLVKGDGLLTFRIYLSII